MRKSGLLLVFLALFGLVWVLLFTVPNPTAEKVEHPGFFKGFAHGLVVPERFAVEVVETLIRDYYDFGSPVRYRQETPSPRYYTGFLLGWVSGFVLLVLCFAGSIFLLRTANDNGEGHPSHT